MTELSLSMNGRLHRGAHFLFSVWAQFFPTLWTARPSLSSRERAIWEGPTAGGGFAPHDGGGGHPSRKRERSVRIGGF